MFARNNNRAFFVSVALVGFIVAAIILHLTLPRADAGPKKEVVKKPASKVKVTLTPIDKVDSQIRDRITRYRRAASEGGGPVPTFTADGHIFKYSGVVVSHASIYVPIAVLTPPPFEKVVRAYALRKNTIDFPFLRRGLARVGFRTRNLFDDVVPVSILPQEVSTSFRTGQSTTSSSSIESGVSSALTIGFSAGAKVFDIGLQESVETTVEESITEEEGRALTKASAVIGTLSGYNWTLSEQGKVFATQSMYDCYQYTAEDLPGKAVWINVPLYMTCRIYGLDEWNSYAKEINDNKDIVDELPEFHTRALWYIGNVSNYPLVGEPWSMFYASGRIGDARLIVAGDMSYINREGSCLAGECTVSAEQWTKCAHTIGMNTQFVGEVSTPSGGMKIGYSKAIHQGYTHELRKGQSFSMNYKTSGVHALLDGGDGAMADYHFRVAPMIFRMILEPSAKTGKLKATRQKIARSVVRHIARQAATVPKALVGKTNLTADDVKISSKTGVMVGGYPLADMMFRSDVAPPHTGSVLCLQYAVADLGASYSRLSDHMAVLMLTHKSGLLRKIAIGETNPAAVNAVNPGGPTLILPYPPAIQVTGFKPGPYITRMNEQLDAWAQKVGYRKGNLQEQLAYYLDSRPQFSKEVMRIVKKLPTNAREQFKQRKRDTRTSIDNFGKVQMTPGLRELLLGIEPGFYELNPKVFTLAKPKLPSTAEVTRLDKALTASGEQVRDKMGNLVWTGPTPKAPTRADGAKVHVHKATVVIPTKPDSR